MEEAQNMNWRTAEGEIFGRGQRGFLVNLARIVSDTFPIPTIVNIGVRRGASLHCIRAGAPNAILVGVDIRPSNPRGKSALNAVFIHGDSNVVHDEVAPPVHLVFIDGGHGYRTVKGDIAGWIPKIPVGGIVAFHDMRMGGVVTAFSKWWATSKANWKEVPGSPCPGFRAFMKIGEMEGT